MKLTRRQAASTPRLRSKSSQKPRKSFKDWADSIPGKPTRRHRLDPEGGKRLVPVRNEASAKNGRGRSVVVKHGGDSSTLRLGRFDLRSTLGKRYAERIAELRAHVGEDALTPPLATYVDQAARLHLLALLAWSEIERGGGAFRRGELRPAVDAYRRIAADEREILRALGLGRRVQAVPDLDEYLRAKTARGYSKKTAQRLLGHQST